MVPPSTMKEEKILAVTVTAVNISAMPISKNDLKNERFAVLRHFHQSLRASVITELAGAKVRSNACCCLKSPSDARPLART